ncbi:response regulator transcription factor [Microbacterium oleivorans]|uniref:response regulator transcription factor n=1 Tax=Microbacterium oleivorans TaxID=273677 RepID=UPI00203B82D5|nr:response regulator transcription factor [Microbacterium oleivorans]MCM3696358.1 response regulator transcription factor [Microbacterium oleivorans]
MTTVLVVDDQPLVRQAVTDILAAADDIEVIGSAADGREALRAATRDRPDVVVMDIRMPVLDGIAATAAICAVAELSATRVLILTTFEEDEYLVAALRAGASGFVGKGAEPQEIVRAVRAVHAGDALLSPVATRALIDRFVATPQLKLTPSVSLEQLTEREREVLLMVARGRSNQEIAADLFISPHTAKTHVNRIMAKVHAHDRAQLVILAYESGLLTAGS